MGTPPWGARENCRGGVEKTDGRGRKRKLLKGGGSKQPGGRENSRRGGDIRKGEEEKIEKSKKRKIEESNLPVNR